jgi:PAS domain S-box-containing protein
MAAHTAAFQDAVLQYANRVEARAELFRVLLYLVAVLLLGYLLYQFARLRANARGLRRANVDLQREMAERQQAFAALRASAERFRIITESANDAIISTDSAGHIISWNARAEAIFRYTAEEILGAPRTRPGGSHAALGAVVGLRRCTPDRQNYGILRRAERRPPGSLGS